MTMHVNDNHQCSRCGAFYIPYDLGVPCPRCGFIENEYSDFILKAMLSMKINKEKGTYTPNAWWVGSLGDHILGILFKLFDAYEEEETADNFHKFSSSFLAKMTWSEQLYLKDHILEIAIELYKQLEL